LKNGASKPISNFLHCSPPSFITIEHHDYMGEVFADQAGAGR
jgi:hypothetical protein